MTRAKYCEPAPANLKGDQWYIRPISSAGFRLASELLHLSILVARLVDAWPQSGFVETDSEIGACSDDTNP